MHFAHPEVFFLLPLLAAIIAVREWPSSRYRAPLPFPDPSLLEGTPRTWRSRGSRWAWLPVYAALGVALIAWARPQSVSKDAENNARGIDILIAMDTSGSMRALDFDPQDRMAVAKRAAKNFVTRRQYDRIGLVVFAGVGMLQCPLTLDYGALLEFLQEIEVGITSTENTAIGTAIAIAVNHLKKSTAKSKIVILVTDGRSNSGEVNPETAAKAAAALGIKIYTIGVGKRGDSMIPVDHPVYGRRIVPIREDLDEPTLLQIAQETNGRYYRASSPKEFDAIYAQIDKLEKSEVAAPPQEQFTDAYRVWLLFAMALMCAGLGLRMTVFRVVP